MFRPEEEETECRVHLAHLEEWDRPDHLESEEPREQEDRKEEGECQE